MTHWHLGGVPGDRAKIGIISKRTTDLLDCGEAAHRQHRREKAKFSMNIPYICHASYKYPQTESKY